MMPESCLLGWVCGVDDNSILGVVIDDEIGIVVTTTLPCVANKLRICKHC